MSLFSQKLSDNINSPSSIGTKSKDDSDIGDITDLGERGLVNKEC
jgi:hypothetical protein